MSEKVRTVSISTITYTVLEEEGIRICASVMKYPDTTVPGLTEHFEWKHDENGNLYQKHYHQTKRHI